MRKIILTGSAPYFPDWWGVSAHKCENYDILSINTSVLITKDVCVKWFHSIDFFELHPNLEFELRPYEDILYKRSLANGYESTIDWPFHYWSNNTSGTMLFNALKIISNYSFWNDDLDEICLIGCDLIYKEDTVNHFYGHTGTNDPLRLGKECLIKNLNMFNRLFNKMGVKIYNLSTSPETLLPFEKKIL